MHMMRHIKPGAFLPLLVSIALVAASAAATYGSNRQLKVAFIYPTSISDFGFTYSNEIARVTVERELLNSGYNITTSFSQSIAPSDAGKVMEGYIMSGYELIIATGGQYANAVQQVAANYPNIKFVSTAGTNPKPNVAIGFPRNWEASFLLGYACALSTSTKKLGFVAAFDNNNVHTRAINAFYAGAKEADSTVTVTLATINSFLDPIVEAKAAAALMNESNVDCIASMVNDNTVNAVANARNTFSVGYASDARLTSGEYVLSSILFNWTPYFRYWIERAHNDTWVPNESIFWGFADGAINMASWGSRMPPSIRSIMDRQVSLMKQTRGFNPFCEEYAKPWNPDGACLSDSQIQTMRQTLPGIDFRFNLTLEGVLVRDFISYSSPAAIIAVIWVALFLVLLAGSLIDLTIYRDTVVYRTSSPLFCALIGVGIAAIYVSVFGWIGRPTAALCAMRPWLAGVGFSFVYGCILAKNWRVFRIFSDDTLKVFAITNFDLVVKFVVPVTGIELVILVLWQALDPLAPIEIVSPTAADTRLSFCSSKTPAFLAISLCYKAILLILASGLSYLTRRITSDYRESTLIALAVYNTIVIGIIVIVVNVIAGGNVLTQFTITVFGILIIASVIHALVFFPKFWNIHALKNLRTWTSAVNKNSLSTKKSGARSVEDSGRASSLKAASMVVHHSGRTEEMDSAEDSSSSKSTD